MTLDLIVCQTREIIPNMPQATSHIIFHHEFSGCTQFEVTRFKPRPIQTQPRSSQFSSDKKSGLGCEFHNLTNNGAFSGETQPSCYGAFPYVYSAVVCPHFNGVVGAAGPAPLKGGTGKPSRVRLLPHSLSDDECAALSKCSLALLRWPP